jgi:NhaP-type Na+/H+ or K+/H+ antiporter
MGAGSWSWTDDSGVAHVLMCNVTERIPNDLHFHGWHLGNSLRMLGTMDPHLLLHLLLPPLLFESAFSIDFHMFLKLGNNALLLAGPGVAVAAALTGSGYLLLYDWGWEASMLLGAILSATDPVAVVALLREMGVKKSLATLIEAESLLNDGTAVVAYSVLLKAVQAGSLSAWLAAEGASPLYIVWVTFRMAVLGPLWGILLGVFTLFLLDSLQGEQRKADIECVLTLVSSPLPCLPHLPRFLRSQ